MPERSRFLKLSVRSRQSGGTGRVDSSMPSDAAATQFARAGGEGLELYRFKSNHILSSFPRKHVATLPRHARAWPAHPRRGLRLQMEKLVGDRAKPGHDEEKKNGNDDKM
jgi:hypothetical protein